MTNKTVYRKDYKKPAFSIEKIALDFDLYATHALVTNLMEIHREGEGDLILHGEDLELIKVVMDKKPLNSNDYGVLEDGLLVKNCKDKFTLEIVTKIYPGANTELSGLYQTKSMFCTQCEAEGFRRITYYLDRPDILTKYTTKIHAEKEKYPILLSNGNLLAEGDEEGGRHFALWEDPFKKPSYLFALVAGDLAFIEDSFTTMSGRKVKLKLFVEHGDEDKAIHALESLKKAMRWDEEKFGREYDLDIFMIVAVSDFNMGAMENKGLNIFNSKYVLARADTATDQDYMNIESVIGHEYFHNWSGNRVTCRDWFQLSLKEGLTVFRDQEFSRDMNSRAVNRIMDVRILKASQFPEDAGAMAHPVRPDSYQAIDNFYTATVYNKGAEVIRMQHSILGEAGFRRGMDLYFERHDGQAVTIDDFVAAQEDANNIDLSQFKLWYSQAGTPEINVQTSFKDDEFTLYLEQSCRDTPGQNHKKPFHIPIKIALFDKSGEKLTGYPDLIELKEKSQSFKFSKLAGKPYLSLLRDFSAPVILHIERDFDESIALLKYETDGFAKWDVAQKLCVDAIIALYNNGDDFNISDKLFQAFKDVLIDTAISMHLKAEILTMPGFAEVSSSIKEVDVLKLENARDEFTRRLAIYLYEDLNSYYKSLSVDATAQDAESQGIRKLKNKLLTLMMKGDEKYALPLCSSQYASTNMTLKETAFSLIVNAEDENIRTNTIQDFYDVWQDNDLVLDKWFSIQAMSKLDGTTQNVRKLLAHPKFKLKNPNRLRSLIGAFANANPRHFHAIDGSGYDLLAEIILQVDKFNSQVAARLATPFSRAQSFDKPRQELMQKQLQKISRQKLSKDLQELVSKSLW